MKKFNYLIPLFLFLSASSALGQSDIRKVSYTQKEKKVLQVRIDITNEEDIEKLNELGIECDTKGILILKVSEETYEKLKEEEFLLIVLRNGIEIQFEKQEPLTDKNISLDRSAGEIGPIENGTDLSIPDNYSWVYSSITVSSAPPNSYVDAIEVCFEIHHEEMSDLQVDFKNQSGDKTERLLDREYEGFTWINQCEITFAPSGENVNQTWRLGIKDCKSGDTGYLDEWSITIFYSVDDPDLEIVSVIPNSYNPPPGGTITIDVTIRNNSGLDINSGFYTYLYYNRASQPEPPFPDGERDDFLGISGLESYASHTFTFEVTNDNAEEWKTWAVVDGSEIIAETDEYNNVSGITITWEDQSDIILCNEIIPIGTHKDYIASNTITVGGSNCSFIIDGDGENGGSALMQAGDTIWLKNGFEAIEGSVLEAKIGVPSLRFSGETDTLILSDKKDSNETELESKDKSDPLKTEKELIPTVFSCAQNKPNPFAFSTTIEYGLPNTCDVNLTIFNLAGQAVRTLVDGQQSAGFKSVNWDGYNNAGTQVPQGIYFYVFKAGDFEKHHKMLMVK